MLLIVKWFNEIFNGKLSDGLLNREVFYNLQEAKIVIEKWGQVSFFPSVFLPVTYY